MKTLVIVVALSILPFNLALSQANWFWQNPLPTGNNLTDIQFTDEFTGYVTGQFFTFLKTTNTGENWSLISMNIDSMPPGSSGYITSIFYLNSFTGYAACDNYLLQTTNGGIDWKYKFINETANSIYFTSFDTGYFVTFSGKIFKSIDQGFSWVIQYSGNVRLNKIYFNSSSTGFAVGRNLVILKTTNCGSNWIQKHNSNSYELFDINFTDSINGYAGGSFGYFFKTSDGGETWLDLRNSQLGYIRKVRFLTQDTGYVIADNGNIIFKTVNGGGQWLQFFNLGFNISNFFIGNKNIIISCFGGNIYKSTDNGISWQNKISNVTNSTLQSVNFFTDNSGFISGTDNTILKTTNGGTFWNILNAPAQNENYNYVKFIDNKTGYVAGTKLYKTINGSISWDSLFDLSYLKYINILNRDTGYVVKKNPQSYENYTLYRTFNGGNTWSGLPIISYFSSLCISENNDTIYALNSYTTGIIPAVHYWNEVHITTNGGMNWARINIFNNGWGGGHYSSVIFLNRNTGFVSGTIGMRRTTDGGSSWSEVLPSRYYTRQPFFCNQRVGYIPSLNFMYKTTNSAETWSKILESSNDIISCFFTDNNTGYTIGPFGSILKTTNGGGIFVNVSEAFENIPLTFQLYQNYPNPFNPVTKIRFDILSTNNVKLIVYDILGKEIIRIIDLKLERGSYVYEFDSRINSQGKILSSGIYFFQLVVGSLSHTKKMMLIN